MLSTQHQPSYNQSNHRRNMHTVSNLPFRPEPSFSDNIRTERIPESSPELEEHRKQERDIPVLCHTSKGSNCQFESTFIHHISRFNPGFGNTVECEPSNGGLQLWWDCSDWKFESHCEDTHLCIACFSVKKMYKGLYIGFFHGNSEQIIGLYTLFS